MQFLTSWATLPFLLAPKPFTSLIRLVVFYIHAPRFTDTQDPPYWLLTHFQLFSGTGSSRVRDQVGGPSRAPRGIRPGELFVVLVISAAAQDPTSTPPIANLEFCIVMGIQGPKRHELSLGGRIPYVNPAPSTLIVGLERICTYITYHMYYV